MPATPSSLGRRSCALRDQYRILWATKMSRGVFLQNFPASIAIASAFFTCAG